MPVAVPYYLPIRAPRGRLVHAASDITAGRTACGRACSHWRIALARRARRYRRAPHFGRDVDFGAVLDCSACRRALGLPLRTRCRRRP